tara:strand:- start:4161 stop:4835 length:675 start_codon:yes stop_codon:yes gene_type:complete
MLDKINLFLTIIATTIILVILYDLHTDFNDFKNDYEEEQEDKETKLQGIFKKIGDNDKILNDKHNELNTSLTTQGESILENRGLISNVAQTLNEDGIETYEDLKESELKNLSKKTKDELKKTQERRLQLEESKKIKKEQENEKREITSKKIILNVDTPKDLEVCYKNPDDSANRICKKIILEGESAYLKNNNGFTLQRDDEDSSGNARFLNKNKDESQQVTLHY